MTETRFQSDYVIVASLLENKKINVFVAFKGENVLDNLYLLNEFPYDKKDLFIFKKLFSAFSSSHRPTEFTDFFVSKDNFYAIFKYNEETNIKQRYKKETSTSAFDERCQILENILIKIDSISKFLPELAGCISEPENIKVDDSKNVYMNYNLQNIEKYRGATLEVIFKNIHDIIFTLLQPEAEAGFNKQLHIVLDKCKNGVYNSIPELIIELKKAEKISKTSSWLSYFKYQLSLRKPLINKITQGAITASIAAGVIYLAYSKITAGQNPGSLATVVSIGDITYNGNKEDESQKGVSTENEDNQTNASSSADITLTEGLDMAFEDYIVQYGDTVSSICESYYKDSKYVTAIATFNGIQTNEKLTAGTILKLPNRTAIALYISK